MLRMTWVVALLVGCSGVDAGSHAAGEAVSPMAQGGCVNLGGGELQAGLTLGFAGFDVRVTAVQSKDGDPGAHVGFTLEAAAPALFYVVQAGGQSFRGTTASFAAPNGEGISTISFCSDG